MSGWAALGEILGGGVKRQAEDEYAKQMWRNGSAFKILEEARKARAVNMAREAITDEQLVSAGFTPETAPLIRNIMLSGNDIDIRRLDGWGNPNYLPAQAEIGRTMGIGRNPLLGDAVPALDKAGRQRIADLQVAISNTPVARNDIQDGTAFDKYLIGDTGTLTALGVERKNLLGEQVRTQKAQQASSYASAGNSNASAEQTRWETGQRRAGRPDSFNRADSPDDPNKADESQTKANARAALDRIRRITDPEVRAAKRKAVFDRLRESGYGKIVNELNGD